MTRFVSSRLHFRLDTVLLLIPASLACLSSTPALAARARGVQVTRDDAGIVGGIGDFRRAPSSAFVAKCTNEFALPYSAGELRTLASLYSLEDEPEKSVADGGRLTCAFDDEDETCAWYNVQSGGVRFWKARYESIFDMERFHCTSERQFPFDEYFLLAGGEATILPQTVAIETSIPCQFGNGSLSFDFWINSETPTLRICAITSDNYFNCEEMAEWGLDAPIFTTIPPSVDPFRLRIEITGLNSDAVVLLDNIRYEGLICELVNDEVQITREEKPEIRARESSRRTAVTLPTLNPLSATGDLFQRSTVSEDNSDYEDSVAAPPPPPPPGGLQMMSAKMTLHESSSTITSPVSSTPDVALVDVCEALTCSFNEEHSCMYSPAGIGGTLPWSHGHDFTGNKLTGVHQNSPADYKTTGYVFVGENHKDLSEEVFVLESARFDLRRAVQMKFDLFLRSFGPQLKVCIDSFDYCPYSSPHVDKSKYWMRDQKVFIPPGHRKVFFIAGKLSQNLFLAIDNIHVVTEGGDAFCDTN